MSLVIALLALLLIGCSEDEKITPYAVAVVAFTPGENAGFGADAMPDIVLGPPIGGGVYKGSLDVVSLGLGGEIVLDLGRQVANGHGPDVIVFENAFYPTNMPDAIFAEYGEVSVSPDGESWVVFPCDPPQHIDLCAGTHPTLEYDPQEVIPLDTKLTGGDALDFSALGVERARFLRIRDKNSAGAAPSAGFDLDAVGFVD